MQKLLVTPAILAFAVLCACSRAALPGSQPLDGATLRHATPGIATATGTSTQYLYVYNAGSPGLYPGEYARYRLSDLHLLETTAATGVASPEAFAANGTPYFVDEVPQGAFGVWSQPKKQHTVSPTQQFYGVPCQSTSLSIGPSGDFYVVQYCSTNVLKYSPSKQLGSPKTPLAQYAGGNLGQGGITNPTYAAVDPSGDLYVGDNAGGVTYFAAGSKKGVVAFPTGGGGYVNQMVVDANGDVWSIHGPNPSPVYFSSHSSCAPVPSGSIVRNEYAERFSKGALVQHLYTAETTSSVFANNGLSIAVDGSGRIYSGNQNPGVKGVLTQFDPGKSCPNDGLSFTLSTNAAPHVAVDGQGRYYVTNYGANTIAQYQGGTKTLLKRITQKSTIVSITYAAINP